ncbi:MAG: PAS domain S-box protein [Brevinematales bacterium]|nr:PAS domain S-box protein [Brevinematales bacterium]
MAETKKTEAGLEGELDLNALLLKNDLSGDTGFFLKLSGCLREGVWVFDKSGNTIFVNSVMASMLGYSACEMTDKPLSYFISPGSEKTARDFLPQKNTDTTKETGIVFLHKDGREVYTSVKTASFYNKDGSFHGAVSTVIDFSKEKLSETVLSKEMEMNRILSEIYMPLNYQDTSIPKIASLILTHALELTGSKHGYVSEIDPVTGDNVAHTLVQMMETGCGISEADKCSVFPRDAGGKFSGLHGYSLNTGESFYTNSPGEHPASRGVPEGHIPIVRFLSVAVKFEGKVIGQIALANSPNDYTNLDLKSVIRLGEYYGWAIQRYRAQKKLSDNEELLRHVFDVSPNRIYVKDKNLRILHANKSSCEVFGIRLGELLGKTAMEMAAAGMITESEAGLMIRDEKEVLETGKPIIIPEESVTSRDGKVRWFRTIKTPFRYLDEMCVLGVSMEITQIREQEEELGRQLERYDDLKKVIENKDMKIYETYYQLNQIFNSSPVGMCLIDKGYNVIMSNEKYCALAKLDLKDIIGSKCYQVFRSEECFSEKCPNKRILEGEKHCESQLVWERSDETPVPCYVNSKPFFDFHSELIGVIHTYQDISQILKTQEDLKSKEMLFYQSQKMEAIGRLAGGIAHDFNNLLTIIRGYTEILLIKSEQGSEMSESLNEIFKAAISATSLTGQLLAFSRKQVLDFKVLDLNGILTHLEKMLIRVVHENIELLIQPDPAIPPIKADRSQLEQILMNLVVNAHDALPNGGRITISTGIEHFQNRTIPAVPDPVSGDFVRLTIEDNGIGMSQETVGKIFEPFFTTKRVGEGTGLGLPTVFGIVKQHDGYIHVLSDLGKGTRFEIYFPALDSRLSPSQVITVPAAKKSVDGNGELILVVEDEKALAEFARRVLEKNSFRVLTTGTIAEAKDIYHNKKDEISLVFTDLVLTDGFGMEYILYLKNIDPAIKIIATSGYVEKQLDGSFFDEQGIPFLKKPYEIPQFLDTVSRLLHQA